LNPGFLKLFTWIKDFNPNIRQNTTAQVWLRIYGIAQEYWRPKILFAIASSIGTPICTDQLTNKPRFDREFDHFARVLVDVVLRKEPIYRVLVERIGFAFFVDLDFENRPSFCHFCNCIGHVQDHCKRLNPDKRKPEEEQNTEAQAQPHRKIYGAKNQRKDTNNDTIVEVINLEGQTPKVKPVIDPLLESILKNKEDFGPLEDVHRPLVEMNKSPAKLQPDAEQLYDGIRSTASEFVDAAQMAHEDSNGTEQLETSVGTKEVLT
jgi:hypothetical protein